jgi:hypothetical protein
VNSIPTTEKQAERAVIELFELYGWEVNVMREDIHVGCKGIPDLMMVSPHGLILHVEMKRPASSRNPKGRVRKAQKERLAEWRRRGVACCVADGVSNGLNIIARWQPMCDDAPGVVDCCDVLMAGYEWWPA